MVLHHLKIDSEYYAEVMAGNKDFEVRINDRGFSIGDWVILHETFNGKETGKKATPREIVFIFNGGKFGLHEDFVIFQTKPVGSTTKPNEVPEIDLSIAKAIVKNTEFAKMVEIAKREQIDLNIAAGFFKEGYDMAKSIKQGNE